VHRLAVGEEDRQIDVRVALAGVEDAGGFVRGERTVGKAVALRNPAFGDGPDPLADGPPSLTLYNAE
jgi:hypothetical protein